MSITKRLSEKAILQGALMKKDIDSKAMQCYNPRTFCRLPNPVLNVNHAGLDRSLILDLGEGCYGPLFVVIEAKHE